MKNKDEISSEKVFNFKDYFKYLGRSIVFITTATIISNLIKRVKILVIADIIAIIISSVIIVTIGFLYRRYCK